MVKEKKQGFYYGWVVFAVCFLMVMVSLGYGSATKNTYLKAICDDLGFERSLFTLNESMRYIITSLLSMIFGAVVLKLGPRKMVTFGFVFLISAFTLYSFASKLWHFYIGGALLGAGICWTTTTIVGYIVEKWFANSKGTIMGIILAANGLGNLASENTITRIVYYDGNNGVYGRFIQFASGIFGVSGWRLAYRLSALLFLVTGIIVVSFLRNEPDTSTAIDHVGKGKSKKAKRGMNWTGYEMSELLKKPIFYITAVCVFLNGFVLQGMVNLSKTHMFEKGLSTEYVVAVFSIHSLALFLAKILAGVIYDKFGISISFGASSLCTVVSTVSLVLLTGDAKIFAWMYSVISSFALPLETVLIPLLVSQMFGQKTYAKVMGYYLAINVLGSACGVPIANLYYDLFGSYNGILVIFTVAMVITLIVTQTMIHFADKDRIAFIEAEQQALQNN